MSDNIDVDELAAWVAAMVHKKHGFAVTEVEEERRLRAAVIAAIESGAPEIVVALTLNGPSGPVAVEERLTRTAAENLFAPPPPGHADDRKRLREDQRDRDADEARRRAHREAPKPRPTPEVENAAVERPYIGRIVIVVIMLAVAAVVYFASRHERSDDEDDKTRKHEMHHAR
jgi:hypothetical protein